MGPASMRRGGSWTPTPTPVAMCSTPPSNYRDGASEEIVGEVLDGREDRFAVAPKYGVSRDPADPNAAWWSVPY